MKNVHIYDGLLQNKYKPTKIFSSLEKLTFFQKFISLSKNDNAIEMVKVMMNDHNQITSKDNLNFIDWANLFADLMIHESFNDLFPILELQLEDAFTLGQCAQGRSTRLLQIWLAFQKK